MSDAATPSPCPLPYKANDSTWATRALTRATELGHPVAQPALGYQYEYGEGVTKDSVQAVRWYAKSQSGLDGN